MSITNKKNNKNSGLLSEFLEKIKEAFLDGYENGMSKAEDKVVSVLRPEETQEVLKKMNDFENSMLENKIKDLEYQIRILQSKIDVFVATENDRQELIVHMMTTVEEMLHSLEVAGIISENELPTSSSAHDKNISTDGQNDVMVGNSKPMDFSSNNNNKLADSKKYNLN